jgi:hypothetical protein
MPAGQSAADGKADGASSMNQTKLRMIIILDVL